MNFLEIPERINNLLYRREVVKLTRGDRELAIRWTLELIRERNPGWTDAQIKDYYERVLDMRVMAVDQWSRQFGETRGT